MKPDTRALTVVLLATALVVLVLDQVTKVAAVASLAPGESRPVIDGVLHWTLQRNPGAAFGLFQRLPVLFTVLAVTITVAILANRSKIPDRPHALALGLVMGGAVGNLADRLFRGPGVLRGHVVDFIDMRVWPVFNIADSGIVVGAIVIVILSFRADRAARAAERADERAG